MSTGDEIEAALAQAEADWRTAVDEMEQAQAGRAKANADWNQVDADRRKARVDRRKPGSTRDQSFPDRRRADSDRRSRDADVAAFSKVVADRHQAYTVVAQAEANWAEAEAKLKQASDARNNAIIALEEHQRVQRKR